MASWCLDYDFGVDQDRILSGMLHLESQLDAFQGQLVAHDGVENWVIRHPCGFPVRNLERSNWFSAAETAKGSVSQAAALLRQWSLLFLRYSHADSSRLTYRSQLLFQAIACAWANVDDELVLNLTGHAVHLGIRSNDCEAVNALLFLTLAMSPRARFHMHRSGLDRAYYENLGFDTNKCAPAFSHLNQPSGCFRLARSLYRHGNDKDSRHRLLRLLFRNGKYLAFLRAAKGWDSEELALWAHEIRFALRMINSETGISALFPELTVDNQESEEFVLLWKLESYLRKADAASAQIYLEEVDELIRRWMHGEFYEFEYLFRFTAPALLDHDCNRMNHRLFMLVLSLSGNDLAAKQVLLAQTHAQWDHIMDRELRRLVSIYESAVVAQR